MFLGMFRGMGLIGAAFAACLAAPAAMAGDSGTARSVPVAYGDLDLGTATGQAALQARIDAAAMKACGPNPVFQADYSHTRKFLRAEYAQCRADAVHKATAALRTRGVKVAAAY
jgi:UrcA family protein